MDSGEESACGPKEGREERKKFKKCMVATGKAVIGVT